MECFQSLSLEFLHLAFYLKDSNQSYMWKKQNQEDGVEIVTLIQVVLQVLVCWRIYGLTIRRKLQDVELQVIRFNLRRKHWSSQRFKIFDEGNRVINVKEVGMRFGRECYSSKDYCIVWQEGSHKLYLPKLLLHL